MIRTMVLLCLMAFGLAEPLYAAEMSSSGSANSTPKKSESCACMKKMNADMGNHQEMMDQMMMKKLGNKGPKYDERFIDLMIPHHEAAIMMAQDALKNSNRPEIREMAQNIITAQEKEIAQLKKWRKQWYGH